VQVITPPDGRNTGARMLAITAAMMILLAQADPPGQSGGDNRSTPYNHGYHSGYNKGYSPDYNKGYSGKGYSGAPDKDKDSPSRQ
jgi:hypothetical protein